MEAFKPGIDVAATPEGAEAALHGLKEQAENMEELSFLHQMREEYPESQAYLVGVSSAMPLWV